MKKFISFATLLLVSGCAHAPKCGNPPGARVILTGTDSCQVRVRQVVIGSELKIPEKFKDVSISEFTLDWVESKSERGKIELGHLVLVPISAPKGAKP